MGKCIAGFRRSLPRWAAVGSCSDFTRKGHESIQLTTRSKLGLGRPGFLANVTSGSCVCSNDGVTGKRIAENYYDVFFEFLAELDLFSETDSLRPVPLKLWRASAQAFAELPRGTCGIRGLFDHSVGRRTVHHRHTAKRLLMTAWHEAIWRS